MILHNDPLISIYFGDARESISVNELQAFSKQSDLLNHKSLKSVKRIMHFNNLIILKQVHANKGLIIAQESAKLLAPREKEGDYLVTKVPHVGLSVAVADCLPIVFYDTYNHVTGICHAGWQGSVQGIAIKTIQTMQADFNTYLDHIKVFLGPCARVCCYEVSSEFKKNIDGNQYSKKHNSDVLINYNEKIFFDLPLLNRLQLESLGIKKQAFHVQYNLCTICNDSFCSYRRDGENAARQLTLVCLK